MLAYGVNFTLCWISVPIKDYGIPSTTPLPGEDLKVGRLLRWYLRRVQILATKVRTINQYILLSCVCCTTHSLSGCTSWTGLLGWSYGVWHICWYFPSILGAEDSFQYLDWRRIGTKVSGHKDVRRVRYRTYRQKRKPNCETEKWWLCKTYLYF